jgi:hypothetical protein
VRFPCVHAAATTPVQQLGVLLAHLTQPCQPSPEGVAGSACTSTFSRHARRSLALRPAHLRGHQFVTRYPEASDISSPPCLLRLLPAGANRRVGLAPTGKRRLVTAHPLSGHCPAVPQPTQLGGELTILVDDALSADSGPLSIDSISPPSDPSRKSCLLASSRCPYLDIDLRTEAALHSEEATDGARWTILSCCCCPTRSLPRLSKSSRRHLKRFKRAVASFASSGKG